MKITGDSFSSLMMLDFSEDPGLKGITFGNLRATSVPFWSDGEIKEFSSHFKSDFKYDTPCWPVG